MDDRLEFERQKREDAAAMGQDDALWQQSLQWMVAAAKYHYTYGFTWLGHPIIQLPADIVLLQEIVWGLKPEVIIETGVARGGSLIFYASLLKLIGREGRVVGVDIDIRAHNRAAIEADPLAAAIRLVQGSSIAGETVARVRELAEGRSRALVVLDSNHTHDHVMRELELYSPLVKKGGFLVVFDTSVEDAPAGFCRDRPWGKGNNPRTAVQAFIRNNARFVVDATFHNRAQITSARGGYLRCVAD